jgi:hypothetical protein
MLVAQWTSAHVVTHNTPWWLKLDVPCRLYALERMVQVLHFNMHRIYDLWGIFLSHVLEVLASAKAALRTAAMDAVGKAITGALDRPVPARGCWRSSKLFDTAWTQLWCAVVGRSQ